MLFGLSATLRRAYGVGFDIRFFLGYFPREIAKLPQGYAHTQTPITPAKPLC